jgi:ribosomal protein S18 acetylase RimI-like enzyme
MRVGSSSIIQVRRITDLTEAERSHLSSLLVAVVEGGASVGFLPPLTREEADAYWQSVLGPGIILLVAEQDGQIVGTAQLHLALRANARHRAEVARVLVHPDHQRQGIGRVLMTEIEAVARANGRTLLVLDTREGDAANAFYRSLGYQEAGRIPRYARSATGSLDTTVLYYKELEDEGERSPQRRREAGERTQRKR